MVVELKRAKDTIPALGPDWWRPTAVVKLGISKGVLYDLIYRKRVRVKRLSKRNVFVNITDIGRCANAVAIQQLQEDQTAGLEASMASAQL